MLPEIFKVSYPFNVHIMHLLNKVRSLDSVIYTTSHMSAMFMGTYLRNLGE